MLPNPIRVDPRNLRFHLFHPCLLGPAAAGFVVKPNTSTHHDASICYLIAGANAV
jgi:hypothetical protein